MRTVPISRAARSLAEFAAGNDVVVLTDRNRPVAALVSLKNVDRESFALSTNPDFVRLIAKARREAKAGKTYSFDAVKREFDLTPGRARTHGRRRRHRGARLK